MQPLLEGRLRPPPALALALSTWLEATLRLPQGLAAEPGPIRLWPYQKGLADAIRDPAVERVTICKSVGVGNTILLVGVIANHVVNDPCPILCLQPTENDARLHRLRHRASVTHT